MGLDDASGRAATGVFFEAQTINAVIAAVGRFEGIYIDPAECRAQAEGFGPEAFAAGMREVLG